MNNKYKIQHVHIMNACVHIAHLLFSRVRIFSRTYYAENETVDCILERVKITR